MKRFTTLATLVLAIGAMGLFGCEEKGGVGPLEGAGKAADDAMEKAATEAEGAVDAAAEAVDDAAKAVTTQPE